MRDWTCINSLNISNTQTLVVFKSDTSFSSGPSSGNRRLYLCMKLTKVTNDLYYFHLLSDIETSVFPNERVFISEASNSPANDAPMCSTFCQYTDLLNIRTLRRPGTNDDLPNDAALCEPCDSACVVESTEFSGTAPKQTTPAELYRTTIMTTESTLESVKTPTSSSTYFTESTKFERTAPTRTTPLESTEFSGTAPTRTTSADASCVLPADLMNAAWEYNYTDVASNSEQSTTLNIGTTTLQNSVINLNVFGTAIRDWTCINSLPISNTQTLVVFKSDISFTSGPSSGNRRLYLCMKFTKVTNDLYYFHLLSDIDTSVFPNERVFISEAGNQPANEAPMCSTFCQYTDSLKIRTLKRPDSINRCVDNMDRFGTKWNRTAENTLVTVSCIGNYTGTVTRNCSSGGMWNEPDYTQCISESIKNIKTQLDKILAGDSEFPLLSTILDNLENVTSANNELRTGDLVTASALLEDIAKYVTNHTDKISVDQLEGESGITTVVKAVTDYNSVFHNVLDGEFSMFVNNENIVIEVGKTSSAEIIVPDRLQTNDSWVIDSGTEMKLKKNMCSDLTGYSCTFYRNISSLFPKNLLLNREVLQYDGVYDVNSIIADVSIEADSCSDYSVDLRFGHVLGNHSRPVCGFWEFNASNTVNGAWSSFGSLVVESTDSYTLCEYNHTTNFAILMSPERTPSPHNFPLSLISAIGCGISILFLFITIVVHLVLWRYVRTDRSKTLMNLCVALILSYAIFLAGITRTENKAVCTAIAVALHYMFLTDFALMLAEGILIARMVIIVFPAKSIVHWLLPACWVVPGIIVGISAGVTKLNGYGNEKFCWLTLDSNLIWAFIGPAFIVILINLVIIVLTVHKMMTTKGLARKTLEEKSRIGIESICVILPLFGITWVLGAFSVNEDLVMFQYLFAIFNSLQGLFICLFHCFFNKQVKQGYYHFQRRPKANRSNIVVSTDTSNYVSTKISRLTKNIIVRSTNMVKEITKIW
ncbi:G protein-coupled receptor 133 [Mytilus galloprovincialis]|uniref:G protein-coupled receptor 133 n=1 Tax=Mytilus galloprovincialis TaxID=29158 RepID=A0A8B6BLW6_MYTGA|nr:G protein-coupled receptor 133 [Mytilus galloprovincialis]